MSESRIKRRRFLADALFAGGALGAAALGARLFSQPKEPEPVCIKTPEVRPTPDAPMPGQMMIAPPQPQGAPPPPHR